MKRQMFIMLILTLGLKVRILYLTPAWFGFENMLFHGEEEITGLPSFTYPLKGLIDKGYHVDMLLMYTSDDLPCLNIKSDWVSKINIVSFIKYDLTLFKKVISIIKYRRFFKKLLESNDYDFIYSHGSSPAVVRSIAVKKGIPFAQRLYGTFIWNKFLQEGHLKVALKHVVEYLSFRTKKSFLLVTDDGSGGDKVVSRIFNDYKLPYKFYYWKNGVSRLNISNIEIEEFSLKINANSEIPFIFYCARFDDWKRQDRVIKILKLLKSDGVILHAYFAGPFDSLGDRYYNYILELAHELDVIEQCHFLGSITKKEIFLYNKLAIASLSLNDVCNITSVFHEMMSSGALMIIKDDPDVRDYIVHRNNGFLVNSDEDVVNILKEIINNKSSFEQYRDNISQLSSEITKDWSLRVQEEILLIENHSLKTTLN